MIPLQRLRRQEHEHVRRRTTSLFRGCRGWNLLLGAWGVPPNYFFLFLGEVGGTATPHRLCE